MLSQVVVPTSVKKLFRKWQTKDQSLGFLMLGNFSLVAVSDLHKLSAVNVASGGIKSTGCSIKVRAR